MSEEVVTKIVETGFFRVVSADQAPTLIGLGIGMLICLGLSAFCAASENAFFSHREKDLEFLRLKKSTAGNAVLKILGTPKHLLGTVLVLNSFGMIGFVVLAEVFFEMLFNFHNYPWFKFLLDAVIVTLVILIFGEIMPKVYANYNYQNVAKRLSIPMRFAMLVLWPFTGLLVKGTNFLEKRIKSSTPELTPEELNQAIEITTNKEDAKQEKEILKGIVNISQIQVSQVMRPRMDVIALNESEPFSNVLKIAEEQRFSRLPVFQDNFDSIVGVLYIKDLLPHLEKSDSFAWQKLVRPPFFVPENKKIDDLLHEFRQNRNHLAIVADEYGGSSGIITLEDILEEVFGELNDEFDDDLQLIHQIAENKFMVEGKTHILDFLKMAQLPLNYFEEINEEIDTIAGAVSEIAGRIPRKGELVEFKDLKFTIEASDIRKIKKVRIQINSKVENE